MVYSFLCLCCLGVVFFGSLFTCIFFYITGKQKSLEMLKKHVTYENSFQSIVKDLDRELGIRKDLEERLRGTEETLKKLYAKLAVSEERLSSLLCYRQKYDSVIDQLRIQREVNITQEVELKKISYDLEEKNLAMLDREKFFLHFEKKISEKFEILANRIFECNGNKIDMQNRSSLDNLLSPLRLKLDEFKEDIKKKFSQEESVRNTLCYEINNLRHLNETIVQETINLTHALKGNNKVQGNWGEVILSRVLEASGMREGYEFHTQFNIRVDNGRRYQPDVVVHLPDNRDVIIDAKTSLLSYEKYFNSEDDSEREGAFVNYVSSLRSHMKLLEKKNYQSLYNISHTLDCVLMFVPIESAFILALSKEPSLLTEAIEHNILLVSPTTLLVALRIINNLWRYEYQSRYTKEIADRASRLYDKLRLFVDDINKIGQHLDKVQESYCLAKNKLFIGSGNIVSQAEKFRLFGVKVKKPIANKKQVVMSSSHQDSSLNPESHDDFSSSCMK